MSVSPNLCIVQKSETLRRRASDRNKARAAAMDAHQKGNIKKRNKKSKAACGRTPAMLQSCKLVCDELGVPYHTAVSECVFVHR